MSPLTHSSSTDSLEDLKTGTKKREREGSDTEESSTEGSPIDFLHGDALRCVFLKCSLMDLTNCAQVCKFWNKTTLHPTLWKISRLNELCPSIQVFGAVKEEDQKGFMLKVVPIINRFAKLKILENAGISVVTVCEGSIEKIATKGFGQIQRAVLTRIGGREVTGTWVMTNSGLEGTGDLTFAEQKKAVNALGFDMLELVPTFALCHAAYAENGAILFGDQPLTYVRLADSIQTMNGTENIILGGSSDEKGPNVRSYANDEKVSDYFAGAMKKV